MHDHFSCSVASLDPDCNRLVTCAQHPAKAHAFASPEYGHQATEQMPVPDISRAPDQSLIADELAFRFIPPSHGQKSQDRATAKALGLAIPANLLTLADELHESAFDAVDGSSTGA